MSRFRKDYLAKVVIKADKAFSRLIIIILILTAVYLLSTLYDIYSLTKAGRGGIEYHDFSELSAINPDICAWIRLEGTNIDHPVVQGKDNYEYTGLDFNRNDYAGGCIFLDADNNKALLDTYLIIHGHHMSGGAMFGDLEKYANEDFFMEHTEGELVTPDSVFDLTVAGTGVFDAYDSRVYNVKRQSLPLELLEECSLKRELEFREDDKLLALSTCFGDMSNNRTVVFVRARYAGRNEMQ